MDIGALINAVIDAILFLPCWVVEKWGAFGFFLMPVILAVELLPVVFPLWFLLPKKATWNWEDRVNEEDRWATGKWVYDPNPPYSSIPGNVYYDDSDY